MSNKDHNTESHTKKLMEPKTHTIEHELTDISKTKLENPDLETLLKTPKTSSTDKK